MSDMEDVLDALTAERFGKPLWWKTERQDIDWQRVALEERVTLDLAHEEEAS